MHDTTAQTSASADDHELALEVARAASARLLAVRAAGAALSPDALRATGDRAAHNLIVGRLAEARPGDAILSEEGFDDPDQRVPAARCWIVDPLDGTREFGIDGARDWAVHVALVIGHRPVAGAVTLPALGDEFVTGDGELLASRRAAVPSHPAPVIVVSRTRAPSIARPVAEALGATLVPRGSAGAKAMAVVTGDADIYLHAGGQYEWDSAAPVAVAAAAGLHTSRLDGSPLTYNQADPYLPDLLICRPELAEAVLTAVAAVAGED